MRGLATRATERARFPAWILASVAFASLLAGAAGVQQAGGSPGCLEQRVQQPALPDYITGDECLFCHRFEVGKSWQTNRHNLTIRPIDSDETAVRELRAHDALEPFADRVDYVLGNKNRMRFLKKARGYGQLELLSIELVPAKENAVARLLHAQNANWDASKFGDSCAGCHTTQLDSRKRTFAAVSLDCYVCHGAATLDHTKDTAQVLLARARKESPRVVVSICGQCHLRGGRSKSTGLPYPNNFVAGGELFGDFAVDWTLADDLDLNPGDRHIYQNARDVIERGKAEITCLNCHSVHEQSAAAHRRRPNSELCLACHLATGPKSVRRPYVAESPTCECATRCSQR